MTRKPFEDGRSTPLAGLRVLDLTRLAAGNMLTHMMADFGADVIKVERPGTGDDLRRFGTHEAWWKAYSRSKRSLTLNLRSGDGRDILLTLVETADVLVENFVPGTLERWGAGPDALMVRNPALVIARVSGWGQTGPYAQKPGFGSLIEGMSGFAAMTGFADREPLLPPLALADMIAGLAGFGGVLAALRARDQGQANGQVVDLSLFEPLFSILGPMATAYAADGSVPKRSGNWGDVAAPRNVYRCADGGHVAMSATMQSMWERLAEAIGRPELVDDPRFQTNPDRVRNRAELEEIVGRFFAGRTVAENLSYFEERGVTVGPICDIRDLMEHPFIQGRKVIETYGDPDLGELPMHAPFPRLSDTPATVRAPAPTLGEHTDDILLSLGLSPHRIAALRDGGVI
ncbi:MAG: CoA transferase [Boseongicola sp. SB0664_bin_43]|uniref:CoA transferase n=1 Tax=Boseongicola sp. SB0664_bin_43 TaxID=2604844 RepID=A0A6B0Y1H7_9RHOB|nr:CoA transferase [Boseongicola sp. SB0664_bin_43]